MKNIIIHKTKKGKLVKQLYTKGPFIGEYCYIHFDEIGNFVEKLSNRELTKVNQIISTL